MSPSKSLFSVRDKIVIITGGSGIIGSELAKGYLEAGAKVIILDKNEDRLNASMKDLSRISKKVFGITCNVLDELSMKDANDRIMSKYGQIDVLVNAAGGQIPGTTLGIKQAVFDLGIDNFNKVMELNLNGTVLPTFIFGKTIASLGSGSIINISSMASFRTITRVVGYSAAKAAIDNFTRWMAMEMAMKYGDGIRVNAIAPGFFVTHQNKDILVNKNGSYTARSKAILRMTPFKRFGQPSELVGTALFLSSQASGFITGSVIPVDGGFNFFSGV